jgi:hypothetical protein
MKRSLVKVDQSHIKGKVLPWDVPKIFMNAGDKKNRKRVNLIHSLVKFDLSS